MLKFPELDSIDIEILMLLQENAEMPVKQIANKVYRSESTTHERIKSLRSRGIIKSSIVLLDLKKLQQILTVYTLVQLNDHSAEALNNFHKAVSTFDEVMECYHTAGDFDFQLKVVTTSSAAYYNFLNTKLGLIPHLGGVRSFIVIAEHKHVTAYKLS
ncbi:Lrp/AsnC family transcriptional regulator [Pedobacter sp. B4-66]|uniref:Lrp/AsnC family transcriptional regulator n=1 Tax=Pedobacter sp. B4-66 TaxID=2817280 RepID=UPI001BD9F6E7|nr:Lrp/AsnC family transcriptional regulator [Pedobacter sp. B4-66]